MKAFKSILVVVFLFAASSLLAAQEIVDAVKNNDLVQVRALIEKDASRIQWKDPAGNTLLHHAAIQGSVAMVGLLLLKGADINAANVQLNTPLHEAIINRNKEAARALIERGSDLEKKNILKKTPLHLAALYTRKGKDLVELLIAKGAVIDSRDDYQRTPFLLVARQTGNVELGALLLKHGADINAQDRYGDMPLNLAAWRGFKGFIDLLLDHGADFDTTRGMAVRMLRFAADCGSVRLFNVVLQKDNNLLASEQANRETMRRAIAGGSIEIVKILLAKNIPIPAEANGYGWTPMHDAAMNGHASMVVFLAEKGVGVNTRTLSGKSPYNLAEENDHKEALQALSALKAETGPERFPELEESYLGQAVPGNAPRLFAPDIVSSPNGDDNHGGITFTPDGNEIYWNCKKRIWGTKLHHGKWTIPEPVSFSKTDFNDDNPFITPDGKKMFFTSFRPLGSSEGKENIWYSERTASGWSEPRPVSPEVNAMRLHWGISVSSSGTLYFGGTGQDDHGRGDIYCSRSVNGEYTKPVNLGPIVNSQVLDHCPYIAPDESSLIFSRMDNTGAGFYICFKNKNGQWEPPSRLDGELEGVCPIISPDGKYFFFSSDGIYWMDAKIIEKSRAKEDTPCLDN